MTLSTDPDQVREVAGQVTDIVGRYRGLVISSQTTSGQGGPPQPIPLEEAVPVNPSLGAEFQLRVPASKLEQALDDLSGLGLVVSRTEGSQDITGRFNSTRAHIASLTSERDTLIEQLAKATSPVAVHAIRHRLAVVRHDSRLLRDSSGSSASGSRWCRSTCRSSPAGGRRRRRRIRPRRCDPRRRPGAHRRRGRRC